MSNVAKKSKTDADTTQVINAYFHLANRLRAVQAVSEVLAEHARNVRDLLVRAGTGST